MAEELDGLEGIETWTMSSVINSTALWTVKAETMVN